jgi:hypothetical protein
MNPYAIASDNIPGTRLSGANDAVKRVKNGGVVSIALAQTTGICSEVVPNNRSADRGI